MMQEHAEYYDMKKIANVDEVTLTTSLNTLINLNLSLTNHNTKLNNYMITLLWCKYYPVLSINYSILLLTPFDVGSKNCEPFHSH